MISKVATSCNDLTLSRFLRCIIHSDFEALVIRKGIKRHSKEYLETLWGKIYDEYNSLINGEVGDAYLGLLKQKVILSNKIYLIQICLNSLSLKRNEELIKVVNKMGIKSLFRAHRYEKDLVVAVNQLKSMIARLKKVENGLKPFMTESDEPLTEKTFSHSKFDLDLSLSSLFSLNSCFSFFLGTSFSQFNCSDFSLPSSFC